MKGKASVDNLANSNPQTPKLNSNQNDRNVQTHEYSISDTKVDKYPLGR